MMRTSSTVWWRVGTFVAVAAGVLGFTAGPASALPKDNCRDIITDYQYAAAQSSQWYATYQWDLWEGLPRAWDVDYPKYLSWENTRINRAQLIMEYSC